MEVDILLEIPGEYEWIEKTWALYVIEGLIRTLVAWVKVFRIIPEFRILRLTFQRKSASRS